jgi:hypothetical protein
VQVGANITVTGGVISLNYSNVSSALGYVPVNSQGDVMSGTLTVPTNGLVVGGVGGSQLVANGGGIGIGTATNDASALLDVSSTTRGVLIPRVTLAERNAIAAPANGLQIFNKSNNKIEFWDSGFWRTISTTSSTGVSINGLTPPDQFMVYNHAGTYSHI